MNVYDLTRPQLADLVASWSGSPVHAARLWRYLYREGVQDFEAMLELPGRLRARLAADAMLIPLAPLASARPTAG